MELDALPRCMPLKAVPYLKRGSVDMSSYMHDSICADLGMTTKMVSQMCPVPPQVPRPAHAIPNWRHTGKAARAQQVGTRPQATSAQGPNAEALMAAVNEDKHFLISVLHSQWLDGITAHSQDEISADEGFEAKMAASRSMIILADLADPSDMKAAHKILTVSKNMPVGIKIPAFVVWIRGQQGRADHQQVLQQVQPLLSSGADDVILNCDGEIRTNLEVSMLRVKHDVLKVKEQSEKRVEDMSWQWTHMYWQWLLSFPRIDTTLEVEGRSVGDLKFVHDLGNGCFAKVHEAKNSKGESRAVKVFHKKEMSTVFRVEAMYREILMYSKIPTHPNLAKLHEVLHTTESVYLCLEYGGSESLFGLEVRQADQKFKLTTAQQLFAQIADAVAHLHNHTLYHGDIKPENIVVNDKMQPKLIDFGSMSHTNGPLHKNLGTLPFVAPEALDVPCQFLGGPADCFSMGVVLLEMVCGVNYLQKLLEMNSKTEPSPKIAAKLRGILASGPPFPETLKQQEPEALTMVLVGSLNIDPMKRFDVKNILHSNWIQGKQ